MPISPASSETPNCSLETFSSIIAVIFLKNHKKSFSIDGYLVLLKV